MITTLKTFGPLSAPENLPKGLTLLSLKLSDELHEAISNFSDWNKDISRDRAFFGFKIDYTRPNAPAPLDNIDHPLPALLAKETKLEFNSLLLEKFNMKQGVGQHSVSPVQGDKVYMYFFNEDANMVVYTKQSSEDHEKYLKDSKEYNDKKIKYLMKKSLSQDASYREKQDTKIAKLVEPHSGYSSVELFIPKNSLIEMDSTFLSKYSFCIPKRVNIYSRLKVDHPRVHYIKTQYAKKQEDYKLFTLTFSAFKPTLFESDDGEDEE